MALPVKKLLRSTGMASPSRLTLLGVLADFISALISCVRNAHLCIHTGDAMRARTSDALRKELEDDIEHGRLSPGDRLDEQTLATRFEVSRTPAREALLQL